MTELQSISIAVTLTPEQLEALLEAVAARVLSQIEGTADVTSPWLTVDAAASYAGVTVNGLRKWIERGEIPKYQPSGVGGRVFLRREDLDAYIDQGGTR